MPRLVRRAPLRERVRAYLDPFDWLLWLSELLNDDGFDEWLQRWSSWIGVGLNVAFVIARSYDGRATNSIRDDVFGDDTSGSGWLSWATRFIVHFLTLLCCLNALYTFFRKRHYRLFEQPVDVPPATPSARRVKVESTPLTLATATPFRIFRDAIERATSANERAYSDGSDEVWELSVWDPRPSSLTLFTLFSPGHLLLYFSLLPPGRLDLRPSVTIVTSMVFGALLTTQLSLLNTNFTQQAKDIALVHGQVLNEYDTKYVKPTLNRPVRSVGIQVDGRRYNSREVDVYTPTGIVNRGFHVSPNPFVGQTPNKTTIPSAAPSAYSERYDYHSSPIKSHYNRCDGGNMGVFSHAASPLRKTAHGHRSRGVESRGVSPLKRVNGRW
ncbi:hypothetical protein K470DRAFT_254077 [Piedraia hortae CBS 480.64]|uniref:Meiotically up-regulated gene 154 protein n=1 Tax=Piedraia hortae CBS 480.64 TaxID=1314780 RepID=A0A6A7CB15_9PEZI|nr:hypothetical protein K470DRAFT_254077 [Piedraia hortae CBS 480.64]